MSQQINLLLPELRPRFDWLALPVVAGVGVVGLLLVVLLTSLGVMRVNALRENEAALRNQLAALQQQVQSLAQSLAARQGDSTLDKQLAGIRTAVAQRQEVLRVVTQGDLPSSHAYSGLLQGFSRQIVEGVWLTGFSFAHKNIEIRGRLTDPALLPVYINRLNDEAAFAGRRFAALDMKGVDPVEEKPAAAGAVALKTAALPRFTEFALRTEPEKGR